MANVITNENKNDGNDEAENVRATRLIIGSHALAKPIQFRKDAVFADGLEMRMEGNHVGGDEVETCRCRGYREMTAQWVEMI